MDTRDEDCGHDATASALMRGYCRGDRQAFEELHARVAPAIFAELMAWTLDRQRAERLLDETFQTLHRSRSFYVEGADPVPWIFEIARSEFVLDRRREAREARGGWWSRIRTGLRGRAPVEVEARS